MDYGLVAGLWCASAANMIDLLYDTISPRNRHCQRIALNGTCTFGSSHPSHPSHSSHARSTISFPITHSSTLSTSTLDNQSFMSYVNDLHQQRPISSPLCLQSTDLLDPQARSSTLFLNLNRPFLPVSLPAMSASIASSIFMYLF